MNFLKEALASVTDRRILVPAILLLLVLTFSNIVILLNLPKGKGDVPWPFIVAAVVRLLGLLLLFVALMRIIAGAPRSPFRIDGAFWLSGLVLIASMLAASLLSLLIGEGTDLGSLLLTNLAMTALLAPLARWIVAIAVERPLAWAPRPYLRSFRLWLPQLLLWSVLLVTPPAVLHAYLDLKLLAGAGGWFWPLALFDGALSAVMLLLGLALNVAAYRRVAQP